ncbi:MAG: endopeptidase La, partial [Proteobacteria bacterium]|nr:endopeptidase La [Pseudomonadota bacterium]
EKLLAALRGGLRTVLIPKENEKDLAEIPENVKRGMTIIAVGTVDEVLEHALVSPLIPIDWDEEAELKKAGTLNKPDDDVGGILTH